MAFTTGQLLIGEPSTQVDRTQNLWNGGQMTFTGTRGERGQLSMDLIFLPDETYDPQIGWPVWVYDPPVGQPGAECRFVGTIEDRDAGYIGDAGLEIWSLSVLSLEQLYDTQPCPEVDFDDGTDVASIVGYLFATVDPPVSVTIGTITGGVSLDKRTYTNTTNVWSAIKQLAVDANRVAFIDPRDQKFYFVEFGARVSAFTLLSEDMLQNGTSPLVHYKQSRSDFRSSQVMQAPPGVLPPANAQFDCDGATDTFTLPLIPDQVLGATLTTSVAGTATGTFSGVPSPGDTITVGGIEYTWQAVLDNTIPNEVLIGATAADCGNNLAAALACDSSQLGVQFSAPTVRNLYAQIVTPGATFTIRASAMGTSGNDVALAESCANFVWSAASISGGSNALGTPLLITVAGAAPVIASTPTLIYTPGSSTVQVSPMPGSGQTLTVTFSGPSTSQIAAGNSSATTLGVGSQYQLSTPRNVVTQEGMQQQDTAILSAFSVMPGQFVFQSFHPGFFPGDILPTGLTVPAKLATRVNPRTWLIQDVHCSWLPGFENLPDDNPNQHFLSEVTCIDSVQFNPYQSTLQRMLDVGSKTPSLTTPEQPITGSNDAAQNVYQWSIQVQDTTVGDDKSPHIVLAAPLISLSPLNYRPLQVRALQGALRQTLSADLVIRLNKLGFGSPTVTTSWTFTFPSGWPVDDPIYIDAEGEIANGDVIYIDVVSGPSPVVKDANGVASVTLVAA